VGGGGFTYRGARRSFDDASAKRPRSNSITQSLASSSSFAASTLRDKVDSVFAKPSAPARKKDQRKTIMPEGTIYLFFILYSLFFIYNLLFISILFQFYLF
jgi:hypothetical protein